MEYSKTGEYVLAGTSHGVISVFRCADGESRLKNTWADGAAVSPASPVRRVQVRESCQAKANVLSISGLEKRDIFLFMNQDGRAAEVAHWNDYDRNEVGSSCRASGDIHLYNFRTRGSSRGGDDAGPSSVLTNKQVGAQLVHPMNQSF